MVVVAKNLPPMTALIAFEAVARHLSFTAAAGELRVSQAAVSQQVKSLEAYLKVGLVRRKRPQIGLTPEGEVIAAAVGSGLERIADAIRLVGARRHANRLSVVSPIAFSSFWLMPRLPGFHAKHPHIDLRLVTSDVDLDWDLEGLDVGIVFAKRPPAGYDTRRLFGDEIVVVGGPDKVAGKPPIRDAVEAMAETLLHLEVANQDWMMTWDIWFKNAGIAMPRELAGPRFNNYVLLIQAALDGRGLALGWRRLIDPLLRRAELAPASDVVVVPKGGYFMCVAKRLSEDRTVRAFQHWLQAEAAADW